MRLKPHKIWVSSLALAVFAVSIICCCQTELCAATLTPSLKDQPAAHCHTAAAEDGQTSQQETECECDLVIQSILIKKPDIAYPSFENALFLQEDLTKPNNAIQELAFSLSRMERFYTSPPIYIKNAVYRL